MGSRPRRIVVPPNVDRTPHSDHQRCWPVAGASLRAVHRLGLLLRVRLPRGPAQAEVLGAQLHVGRPCVEVALLEIRRARHQPGDHHRPGGCAPTSTPCSPSATAPHPTNGCSATPTATGATAHTQGRIAGENALGGSRQFAGSLGTQVVKVFASLPRAPDCATTKPPPPASNRSPSPQRPTTTTATTRATTRSPCTTPATIAHQTSPRRPAFGTPRL
jgi:hypothetical protein